MGVVLGVVLGKKIPPKSGGEGYFARKGVAKIRRIGAFWGVFRAF